MVPTVKSRKYEIILWMNNKMNVFRLFVYDFSSRKTYQLRRFPVNKVEISFKYSSLIILTLSGTA